jgi:hypothetical protein
MKSACFTAAPAKERRSTRQRGSSTIGDQIPYEDITIVRFADRYATVFRKYLREKI